MRIISIQTEEESHAVYNLSVGITRYIVSYYTYVYTCSFKVLFLRCLKRWIRVLIQHSQGGIAVVAAANRAYRMQSFDRLGKTI